MHPGLQRGSTLVVSLLMLVVLTLFALSSISSSSVSLRIVHNMQLQQEAEAAAQAGIDTVLSSLDSFTAPATQVATINGHMVVTQPPACIGLSSADGYSVVVDDTMLVPEETFWEVRANATEMAGGAQAQIHQGVSIRLTAGGCL